MANYGEQMVTFYLHGELFGLEMKYVKEIIRPPELVRVPGVPPHFLGLANLRGEILPLVDGRKLLGLPDQSNGGGRVLVLEYRGVLAGCLVDRLAEVVNLENYSEERLKSGDRAQFLSRVVKNKDNSTMVMVLAIDALFPDIRETGSARMLTPDQELRSSSVVIDTKQYVSFRLGKEEFALPAQSVQEIVRVPERISCAPGQPQYMDGLFSLRRRTVPLLNLGRYLNVEHDTGTQRAKVVVVDIGSGGTRHVVGLCVDAITEVLRLANEEIEPLPEVFQGQARRNIKGICKRDDGARIIYLLDPQSIEAIDINLETDDVDEEMVSAEVVVANGSLYVIFLANEEEYGLSIHSVREIIRLPDIVKVPHAPPYVEGVINIRGEILPVINLRKKLNLSEQASTDRSRIVVVYINDMATGLIVDEVKEVRNIADSQIVPVPAALHGNLDARVLDGVVKFTNSDRLILLFDLDKLLAGFAQEDIVSPEKAGNVEVKADEQEDEGSDCR